MSILKKKCNFKEGKSLYLDLKNDSLVKKGDWVYSFLRKTAFYFSDKKISNFIISFYEIDIIKGNQNDWEFLKEKTQKENEKTKKKEKK